MSRFTGGRRGWALQRAGRGAAPREDIDPNYFEAGRTDGSADVEIYLDGVRQPTAIKAHRGQGWVTQYRVDDDTGHVLLDGVGRPRTQTTYGKVEFRRCG